MLPMCDQTQCYSMDGKIMISKLTMKARVEENLLMKHHMVNVVPLTLWGILNAL